MNVQGYKGIHGMIKKELFDHLMKAVIVNNLFLCGV